MLYIQVCSMQSPSRIEVSAHDSVSHSAPPFSISLSSGDSFIGRCIDGRPHSLSASTCASPDPVEVREGAIEQQQYIAFG